MLPNRRRPGTCQLRGPREGQARDLRYSGRCLVSLGKGRAHGQMVRHAMSQTRYSTGMLPSAPKQKTNGCRACRHHLRPQRLRACAADGHFRGRSAGKRGVAGLHCLVCALSAVSLGVGLGLSERLISKRLTCKQGSLLITPSQPLSAPTGPHQQLPQALQRRGGVPGCHAGGGAAGRQRGHACGAAPAHQGPGGH